jgi:hypothetical protein
LAVPKDIDIEGSCMEHSNDKKYLIIFVLDTMEDLRSGGTDGDDVDKNVLEGVGKGKEKESDGL